MPLHPNAENRIRRNLQDVKRGVRPQRAVIGCLTDVQLNSINAYRRANNQPEITAEIIFKGKHLYESRCLEDGYTIEEVIIQIKYALDPESTFKKSRVWTAIKSPTQVMNKDGKLINHEAVFECTANAPYPELNSVIPRGDGKNHKE